MPSKKKRRIAAIMFTDIVGYTALMQRDENAAVEMRSLHRQEFKKNHELYNGDILQYYGDGTLSVFASGLEAVECAIDIQMALQKENPVPLRIGLHLGDIVFDGTEVYGDGVNLASRIESLGVAGSILLSGKLNDELNNHPHILTQSLGKVKLKNISKPVEVYAVTNKGIKIPKSFELKGIPKKEAKSVAVLPFVNMSSSQDNEYFSDGMTEEIINALSKIKGLKVTSRTSSFHFKKVNLPISRIGQELNVSTILEGSVRLSSNKMRITAQLIDVKEDYHFWSETFDRSLEDVFAVQDEISLLIAERLREHIGHFDIVEQLIQDPEIPVDVYQGYLKSRYHILKMGKSDIETGISILEKIIEDWPHFALAHLGMHLAYTLLGTIGLVPLREAFAKGQPFLDKAMELDENLPECQLHLSYASLIQKWDLPGTYRHLNRVYEAGPIVEYYPSMASTLVAEGRFAAARTYIETALQLDPFSSVNYHLKGFIDYCEEKYDSAISSFEKAVELKSDFKTSTLFWGQALLLKGKCKEGLAFFEKLPQDETEDVMRLGGTTMAYAVLGKKEQAEKGIVKLEAALETDLMGRALNLLILCNALLGKTQETIKLIEKGIAHRLPMMIYLFVEPILKPMNGMPGFQKLRREVLGEDNQFGTAKRKYQKSLINKTQIKKYRNQLDLLMLEEEPYLDPNLTLRALAEMMEIPSNHLSQLLNEGYGKNFADFVNSYRLETFKSKVADPTQRNLTILALAYDSGFNSKTVFNTYFKKTMGTTPRTYWKKTVS
ncbi:helix-turn-helix domain-containing protein [Arenibacter sp. BSSL-BM3]|uniref:Helix-turn-helix domain-containing protein n=1 Tax=Arenibacter arenosicollis TaxID=2762274 RepID=A0ABR7QTA3_9FLAO|nr:helix-turn-helix domain-containing protein [Arenibacter arenosicollis]MBC8770299.1 helix-turn-helix domain-containing protein [Arenibacter arenosicollis]